MKRKINGQQLALKAAVEFSASIRDYRGELEKMGRKQISQRLKKKAVVTGADLMAKPNIESLAEFIRESRMFDEGKEIPLGIVLCVYSDIEEDSEQLLEDLEFLNRVLKGR